MKNKQVYPSPEITSIANRLVELTRKKFFLEAQIELFSENAIGLEPEKSGRRSVTGLKAMQEKEQNFLNAISVWHRIEVSEPITAANYFSVQMQIEVTLKAGQYVLVNEIIVYEVAGGKIITEQFFY
jgi:hypothetical protein